MRVLIVGDLHLNSSTPSSRIDNYGDTILSKVEFVLQHCIANNISKVFFLGDVFHQPQQPIWYMVKVFRTFLKFKTSGITLYSIIGNHDISLGKVERVDSSALGMAFTSGLIQHFTSVEIDGTIITGTDYAIEVPTAQEGVKNILLAHMFYEQPFSKDCDSLDRGKVESLGYDAIILGHDHNAYEPIKVGKTRLFRFGSLSRGTSHHHHLLRDINVLEIDTSSLRTKLVTVPSEPAERVFSVQSMEKYNQVGKKEVSSFKEGLRGLIEMMKKTEDSGGVWERLDSLGLDQEVHDTVKIYLVEQGI